MSQFLAKVEAIRKALGLKPAEELPAPLAISEAMVLMGIKANESWALPERVEALVEALDLPGFGKSPAATQAAAPAPRGQGNHPTAQRDAAAARTPAKEAEDDSEEDGSEGDAAEKVGRKRKCRRGKGAKERRKARRAGGQPSAVSTTTGLVRGTGRGAQHGWALVQDD